MIARQFVLPLAHELIVEEFCCAGGMGHAIELAIGRHVDIAVNHDDDACSLYRVNHPQTEVHCADVFGREVDPVVVTGDLPVGLLHMSPDCTDHSQAKGGQPRSKKLRALSWIMPKWGGKKRPRIITLENVREILKWGPLVAKRDPSTGRVVKLDGTVAKPGERVPVRQQYLVPDPKQLGKYWRRLVAIMAALGYVGDWWEECAADHGAATRRVRLFAVFRCDGVPIVRPQPTYFEKPTRGQRRWRAAHEAIDFSIGSRSIFDRKKPLADATMRRIAHGLRKFVLDAPKPFIVNNMTNNVPRPVSEPMAPILTGNHKMLVAPTLVPVTRMRNTAFDARLPIRTITTAKGGETALATALLVGAGGPSYAGKPADVEQPLGTLLQQNHRALVTAFVEQANGGHNTVLARGAREPLSTIMTKGANQRLVTAHLTTLRHHSTGKDLRGPMPTISAGGEHHALVEYHLSAEAEVGALRCAAFLIRYYGEGGQWGDLRKPAATITTKDRLALVTVWIEGDPYVIVDICLRMLTPRELANATSFPPSYVLDRGHDGRVFSKKKQVSFIGNAVPPLMGAAVIRAQWDSCTPLREAA